MREKVAAALDILCGRAELSEEAWELAGTVLEVSDRARGLCIDAMVETARRDNAARAALEGARAVIVDEHKAEAAIRRVAAFVLGKLDPAGRSRADLRRSLASRDRGYFDAALERLVAVGQAAADERFDGTIYKRA